MLRVFWFFCSLSYAQRPSHPGPGFSQAAMEEQSRCWDPSDPAAFRDFLVPSSSAQATLSLPLVTSLNLSQGVVVSEVGLGRTNPIPLGNEG